jgi:hypothetical protein
MANKHVRLVCLCLGTFASLPAGYILAGGYGWRLFFYVEFAFGAALLLLAFFFVEETSYDRKAAVLKFPPPVDAGKDAGKDAEKTSDIMTEQVLPTTSDAVTPRRKSFVQTLSLWGRIDHDVPFFLMMARSFTYFLVPQALWVVASFGINIGLLALAYSYTFPILITSPPYNWTVVCTSGLPLRLCASNIKLTPF